MLQDICQSIHTHTHAPTTHTYTYRTYIVHVFCVHWPFCTLCAIRIWLSGNFWLFFCQILPVCLINFSVFQSFPLLFVLLNSSVLFCSVLFCLFTHSAAAFEAQLKYLSNFYRRTLSVQIVCCLLQTYSKYPPSGTPWRAEKFSVCKLQFAFAAYGVEHHKCQGRRAWHAKRLKVLEVLKVAWVIVLGTPTLWLCVCVCASLLWHFDIDNDVCAARAIVCVCACVHDVFGCGYALSLNID